MSNPIRFVCLAGAVLALGACSVPSFETSDLFGRTSAQQTVAPAQAQRVAPARVAAPAPAQVARQQAPEEEEVEEVVTTNRWAHRPIGNTPSLSDGDETGGWGG